MSDQKYAPGPAAVRTRRSDSGIARSRTCSTSRSSVTSSARMPAILNAAVSPNDGSARPFGAAECDSARAGVRAGEIDVVANHSGRREVIDQHRVHHARPRPASDIRLEVAERVLVDLDERDVLAGRLGMGRAREAPIVGFQLDRLERVRAGAGADNAEQSIRGENDAGGNQ